MKKFMFATATAFIACLFSAMAFTQNPEGLKTGNNYYFTKDIILMLYPPGSTSMARYECPAGYRVEILQRFTRSGKLWYKGECGSREGYINPVVLYGGAIHLWSEAKSQSEPEPLSDNEEQDIDFGDDSSEFANFDGQCDDNRFIGPQRFYIHFDHGGHNFKDATDCRKLLGAGLIRLRTVQEERDSVIATDW
ncbi:MAG: hypothetical protein F4030_04380 [Gammaproteobacteria bacterium]|nr:hypothetical protein [Gammaproteobacteria bacterium]MYH86820.1 hypothetical protein [Gammaproteobacteria bacterium]MYK04215.1 hypothetical protein [Gammaproteobacteria bacterium]